MRTPLDKELRRNLESAVIKARDIAEAAAAEELKRLSVPAKSAANYLDDEQRALRNRLRAHGRVLGDIRHADGEQEIGLLVTEVAYQHWHRMLFARFLAENDLLIYEDGVTPLSIHDCFELAEEETGDRTQGWQYAALYAAAMLPQIFRVDSPVFELSLAPNDQKQLEQLLDSLDSSTFTASDSLGWVYQFWQSKRKDEVNASEVKIGAKELSPVTQLFTEPYMVSFLLDNALGAWWANQQLTEADYTSAQSEDELRRKAAMDGVPLEYLRFVRTYTPAQQAVLDSDEAPEEKPEPEGPWEPAAGKFEQWPNELDELKTLDPCCGSGHFLVAVFLMLVPIRMEREGLTEQQAIDAVLSQNIFGLELDQRCVEIAAFALALEAWRYPNGGGYRLLPELHLACSGLSVKASKEEWKQLGLGKKNLTIALDWIYKTFSDAPVLGSLINPAKSDASKIVAWEDLSSALSTALLLESSKEHGGELNQRNLESAVVAQGTAKSALLLGQKYDFVVTNPPYLTKTKFVKELEKFVDNEYPLSRLDLSTVFLERVRSFTRNGGAYALVTPQNWFYLSGYKKLRSKVVNNDSISIAVGLGGGAEAFSSGPGNITTISMFINRVNQVFDGYPAIDLSSCRTIDDKEQELQSRKVVKIDSEAVIGQEGVELAMSFDSVGLSLGRVGYSYAGLQSGDYPRFGRKFWEIPNLGPDWSFQQSTVGKSTLFGGLENVFYWQQGDGDYTDFLEERLGAGKEKAWLRGEDAWGKMGVCVRTMGDLPCAIYTGEIFDNNVAVFIPDDVSDLPGLWLYCSSNSFNESVRSFNKKLNVDNGYLLKAKYDKKYWDDLALKENLVLAPFGDNCCNWTFHGHPSASVTWDRDAKALKTHSQRVDETVLQVAVLKLLGYQWPAELYKDIELASEQMESVAKSKGLSFAVDDDGIVCCEAVRGEKSASQRLEELLHAAYGDTWNTQTRVSLLAQVGCENKNFDFWLREKFFDQHSKLFQNRPFIWQIWDGLKDGFSALVNYHLLDRKNLERLIYTYLDDWIRTQKHDQSEGVDGAGVKLAAAEGLKLRLEQILEGEAPYDIFVRWKPLEEQAMGWNPDLNDGVRLNIRPFMSVEDVGKKGAGIFRTKPNIHWKKDRGKDVESAPWYKLGLEYGGNEGDRFNDHHLTLAEKRAAAKD